MDNVKHVYFPTRSYIPIKVNSFQQISINIKDATKKNPVLNGDIVALTLHLKKKTRK